MVVDVLMTSCQVSEKWKKGPVVPQTAKTTTAIRHDPAEPVRAAAGRLFHVLDAAMGDADPTDDSGARERFTLLFAATMQGIAALVASGRVPRSQGSVLVDDAMAALLTSELGVRAVTRPGV